MVFFHTSINVKVLSDILLKYASKKDISPDEFMKAYVEKCSKDTDDTKLSWFIESFLGIHKHEQMLQEIASCVYENESEKDRDYFIIIFYSLTFQITPSYTKQIFKCLLNLSKPLLDNILKFFSSNETLAYISEVAQKYYDMKYVTDKIINPLYTWQPYIAEMSEYYTEYLKKIEQRKFKPPTIPIQPLVLSRKSKRVAVTPAPTLRTSSFQVQLRARKMLTRNAIDAKLEQEFEKNKQKAVNLLNDVRSKQAHYAQKINVKKYDNIEPKESQRSFIKTQILPLPRNNFICKDTTATIKRMESRIKQSESEELEWLDMLIKNCRDVSKVDKIAQHEREEKVRERLFDMEKKHLMGQISFEEAVLAKKKLAEVNKKKYKLFLKEKAKWNELLENWKIEQMEQNRKNIEKSSLVELSFLAAKNELALKKKQDGDNTRKESVELMERALKEKQIELEEKMKRIKEIKILSMIAKEARVQKTIDLTETGGHRFLCEMSIAELEERLVAMKLALHDELEKKKNAILKEKEIARQALITSKNNIQNYMNERSFVRQKQKEKILTDFTPTKEICDLKKLLEEKRSLRIKISNK